MDISNKALSLQTVGTLFNKTENMKFKLQDGGSISGIKFCHISRNIFRGQVERYKEMVMLGSVVT